MRIFVFATLFFLSGVGHVAWSMDLSLHLSTLLLEKARQNYPKAYSEQMPEWQKLRQACVEGEYLTRQYNLIRVQQKQMAKQAQKQTHMASITVTTEEQRRIIYGATHLRRDLTHLFDRNFRKLSSFAQFELSLEQSSGSQFSMAVANESWGFVQAFAQDLRQSIREGKLAECVQKLDQVLPSEPFRQEASNAR